MKPIWIKVDDGETFEGHQGHWADCFFSNATKDQIEDFCESEGMKVEIREMTEAELSQYTWLQEWVQTL